MPFLCKNQLARISCYLLICIGFFNISSEPAWGDHLNIRGNEPFAAPELGKSDKWFNSSPLTLKSLRGKVVLIDFWTYSCINCLRTFPYLKNWYEKYRDKGFTIIGVHTPEFDFEKDPANVEAAIKRYGLTHPIMLDNERITWDNFHNRYWPAHYLIDQAGQVVHMHFGEGKYEEMEERIQQLLKVDAPTKETGRLPFSPLQTPEIYLGSDRAENFAKVSRILATKEKSFTYPKDLKDNEWVLSGDWQVEREYVQNLMPDAALKLRFAAKNVFLVMGADAPTEVEIWLDGKPVGKSGGKDVKDSKLSIQKYRLYELVNLPKFQKGEVELRAKGKGVRFYAFTFGS